MERVMFVGTVIVSSFAAVWFAWGLVGAGASWGLAPIGLAVSAATMLAAFLRRAGEPVRSEAEEKLTGKVIGLASAFEGVMIPVSCVTLGVLGRPDLVLTAIAVIVGLHFLPMAYFLRKPGYYASATGLMAIGIFGAVAIPDAALRAGVIGVTAAVVLWATCWARVLMTPSPTTARAAHP
jgi:hypothetical protein